MIRRLLVCLALLGCGSSGSTGPTPSVGRLRVTITPELLTANVTIAGPNGYLQLVTGTATLSDLAPGAYTVNAAPVTGPARTRERAAPYELERVPACFLSAAFRPDLRIAVLEKRRQEAGGMIGSVPPIDEAEVP